MAPCRYARITNAQHLSLGDIMKASFLGKAFLAAALLGLTAPASARVYDLGDLLSPSATKAASAKPAGYIVRANPTTHKFADVFKFKLSKDANVSLMRLIGRGPLRAFDLKTVRFVVRDSGNHVAAYIRGGQVASFAGQLDDGAYKVGVAGKLNPGFMRGAYRFNANAIAAPVPEPEEWALMILGSGLMAYQVRRKQRKLAAEGPTLTALAA